MTGGPGTPNEARVRFSRASGTRELGKYTLFVKLGSGGQAEVFLAVEQGLSGVRRLVVIKRMRDDLAAHVDIVEMFIDEARLSTRLSHPNIVHTYEVGESEGSYFIAMEYLDGQTLEAILRARGGHAAVTPRMWAAIACEALAGLHYAHELRDFDGKPLEIVHRDMSPHNIFLTYDGEVKIVDFGIAKATLNTLRTETGVLKGKLTYMAPEQTQGKADRRSDIFVVGIILWEALAGRRLFKGEPLHVLNSLVHDAIPEIETPDADPLLKAIVMRALARNPADRFQTAEEMREALDEYVRAAGGPVRKQELGRVVTTMFQTVHDSVKAQITRYMADLSSPAQLREASPSRPEMALPELHVDRAFSSGISKAYDPEASITGMRTRSVGSTLPAPPGSRTPLLAAMLAAGLLVAGGAYLVSRSHATSPPEPKLLEPTATPRAPSAVPVSLDSDPPEAMVEWNGQALGRTPLHIDLPPGPQTVTLTKDGFYDETLRFDVPSDVTSFPVARSAALRPKPAAATSAAPASTHGGHGKPAHAAGSASAPGAPSASAPAPTGSTPAPLAPKDSW